MMLTVAELQDLLDEVTYFPGYEFAVYQGRHEGQHVVIRTSVPDAYNPAETVTLDVHSALPPQRDADCFYSWLAWRCNRIANHESREFFRVRGEVYDDPHADGADQDR